MNETIKNMDDVASRLNQLSTEFDKNWMDFFKYYPEIYEMNFEEQIKWKKFAFKIVNHMMNELKVDELCNKSYDIGYDDGKINSAQNIKDKIKNILEETVTKIDNV